MSKPRHTIRFLISFVLSEIAAAIARTTGNRRRGSLAYRVMVFSCRVNAPVDRIESEWRLLSDRKAR